MKIFIAMLFLATISFGVYAQEKNVLQAPDIVQEKVKSSQDEKNVISDSEDRDEDSYVKSSENSLNEDAFDFDLHPDPDEIREL